MVVSDIGYIILGVLGCITVLCVCTVIITVLNNGRIERNEALRQGRLFEQAKLESGQSGTGEMDGIIKLLTDPQYAPLIQQFLGGLKGGNGGNKS